jgi:hypothetical protein
MRISFFEEFPTKRNLSKSRLCRAHKIYIASENLNEFRKIKKKIKNAVYWPVLRRKEGYWISPFADSDALKRIFSEIPKNQEVMLDLEMPLNRILIIKNAIHFFRNKKLIEDFIKSHKVILCEHAFSQSLLRLLGLSYESKNKIKMMYSSIFKPFSRKLIKAKENKIGIGCIARGIYGNEKLLSPEELENDLRIVQKSGKEAVIFRLGGLNAQYLKVIKNITKN